MDSAVEEVKNYKLIVLISKAIDDNLKEKILSIKNYEQSMETLNVPIGNTEGMH
jgi:hypothetical protein